MMRWISALLFSVAFSQAQAGELLVSDAVLTTPHETVTLQGGTARVLAYYTEANHTMDVSLILLPTGNEDNVLRAGAQLRDGAGYGLRLSALAEGSAAETVKVRRQGDALYLTVSRPSLNVSDLPVPAAPRLALD
ncbi:MAG: hypothetical protein AAFQ88_10505 [Pseudomonadota bacterium]